MIAEPQKKCPDCGADKPLTDFPPAARRRDGRGTYCHECMRVRIKASQRKRAEREGRTPVPRPVLPDRWARCPDCGQVQVLEAFPLNRASRTGRGNYCKPCHNARGRASRDRNGGARNYHLLRRYGITAAQADAMLEAQAGLCALCRNRAAEHVDHCHLTDVVRQLLCSTCNQGLGNFRDDEDLLLAAAAYLARHHSQPALAGEQGPPEDDDRTEPDAADGLDLSGFALLAGSS